MLIQPALTNIYKLNIKVKSSVSDPYHFDLDPDPDPR